MNNKKRALLVLALALCVGMLASACSVGQISAYDYILRESNISPRV